MSEELKRGLARWAARIGWVGTTVLTTLRLFGALAPSQAQVGSLLIILALWGSIASSRYTLLETLTRTFQAGMDATARQAGEREK